MNRSADAVNFVLSLPMVDTPGTKYNYSGGSTQILGAVVEQATGMSIDQFTDEFLFKPLGIKNYAWVRNKDGAAAAASGLRMRSRDMAKFGLLYLNNGKWNDKQLIASDLVAQTLKSQESTPFTTVITTHLGYSNLFWIPTEKIKDKEVTWVQAQGNGGQLIVIDKDNDLVVVVTAGNYNLRGLRKSSWDIYPDFVYPAVVRK